MITASSILGAVTARAPKLESPKLLTAMRKLVEAINRQGLRKAKIRDHSCTDTSEFVTLVIDGSTYHASIDKKSNFDEDHEIDEVFDILHDDKRKCVKVGKFREEDPFTIEFSVTRKFDIDIHILDLAFTETSVEFNVYADYYSHSTTLSKPPLFEPNLPWLLKQSEFIGSVKEGLDNFYRDSQHQD